MSRAFIELKNDIVFFGTDFEKYVKETGAKLEPEVTELQAEISSLTAKVSA